MLTQGLLHKLKVENMTSAFDIKISSIDGRSDMLSELSGKVCLFVNIASKAGYKYKSGSPLWSHARTTRHLWELQKVHEEFESCNFSVVGFPCNQFHQMEPLENDDIHKYIKDTYPFITFPISEKIDVNGENEHAVYKFLKGYETRNGDDSPATIHDFSINNQNLENQALLRIPGNYEKFVVSSTGKVIFRFNFKNWPMSDTPLTNESDLTIRGAIKSLLL